MRGLCCWEEPFSFVWDIFFKLDHPVTSVIAGVAIFKKTYFEEWSLRGFSSLIYYALFAEVSNSSLLACWVIYIPNDPLPSL